MIRYEKTKTNPKNLQVRKKDRPIPINPRREQPNGKPSRVQKRPLLQMAVPARPTEPVHSTKFSLEGEI